MEGAVGLTGGHAEPQRVRGSANLPSAQMTAAAALAFLATFGVESFRLAIGECEEKS